MKSGRTTMELQNHICHNAEELRNTLSDLSKWQKEIKAKDKELQNQADTNDSPKTLPARAANDVLKRKSCLANKAKPQVEEKLNAPAKNVEMVQTVESAHASANKIKDKGNKLVKLGDYTNALSEYTAAIELYPKDVVYYNNRALCYLRLERYEDCIDDCNRSLLLDKTSVKAYYRRMQGYEGLGKNMAALKDCTTVLNLDPKNVEAKNSLKRINERLRKSSKSTSGAHFSEMQDNMIEVQAIDKPPHKRSTKPFVRVKIQEVLAPKPTAPALKISDEEIDKLFNSHCGSYVEVKKVAATTVAQTEPIAQQKTPVIKKKISIEQPAATVETPLENKVNLPTPTNAAQFTAIWRELNMSQKYECLKNIPIPNLSKILGAGFDSETLSEILKILRDYYMPEAQQDTYDTLLALSQNPQMSILPMFMSMADRKVLMDILNAIKATKSEEEVAKIAKLFFV